MFHSSYKWQTRLQLNVNANNLLIDRYSLEVLTSIRLSGKLNYTNAKTLGGYIN